MQFDGVVAEVLGDGLLVYCTMPVNVENHRSGHSVPTQQAALRVLNCEFDELELPQVPYA